MMEAAGPRTAVVFRTHFWDAFVERQFLRLREVSHGCDLFVLVDETGGPVEITGAERVLRITAPMFLQQGFASAGQGSLLWFNGDYPLYALLDLAPGYDYYIQSEYDLTVTVLLAGLAARAARDGIDFIGLTKGEETADWYWLPTCLGAYRIEDIHHQLICLSLFSARAVRHLCERRLALSQLYAAGELTSWPMCEGFIPTELMLAGFRCAQLSRYGNTDSYDHWPPYLEGDSESTVENGFVHPVLDTQRYIASMLKYHVGIGGYLDPNSLFHRKLRRLPAPLYARAVAGSFGAKALRNMRQLTAKRRSA